MASRRPRPALSAGARAPAAPAPASAERWQTYLADELSCPVRVVYTRARKKPLQVRPVRHARTSGLEVRMHSFFEAAPPEVHRAVASWIRSGRRAPRACALLDRWILASLERLPAPVLDERALRVRGSCYDLAELAEELRAAEFSAEFRTADDLPRITWGRVGPSRTRHSIRLGSYDQEGSVVRIHAALDQPLVPRFFVRYVLFHELLHAVYPPRKGEGDRWIHHGPQFRRREHAYADYARALAWEQANIKEVIRSARRGTPMRAAATERRRAARPSGPELFDRARDEVRPRAAPRGEPLTMPRRDPRGTPRRDPRGTPRRETVREAVRRIVQGWLFPA